MTIANVSGVVTYGVEELLDLYVLCISVDVSRPLRYVYTSIDI